MPRVAALSVVAAAVEPKMTSEAAAAVEAEIMPVAVMVRTGAAAAGLGRAPAASVKVTRAAKNTASEHYPRDGSFQIAWLGASLDGAQGPEPRGSTLPWDAGLFTALDSLWDYNGVWDPDRDNNSASNCRDSVVSGGIGKIAMANEKLTFVNYFMDKDSRIS